MHISNQKEDWKDTQWLTVHIDLCKGPHFGPSTHARQLTTTSNSSSGDQTLSLASIGNSTLVHRHIGIHII